MNIREGYLNLLRNPTNAEKTTRRVMQQERVFLRQNRHCAVSEAEMPAETQCLSALAEKGRPRRRSFSPENSFWWPIPMSAVKPSAISVAGIPATPDPADSWKLAEAVLCCGKCCPISPGYRAAAFGAARKRGLTRQRLNTAETASVSTLPISPWMLSPFFQITAITARAPKTRLVLSAKSM